MHHVDLTVRYEQTDAGWIGRAIVVMDGKQEEGETPAFPTKQALRDYLDAQMENFIETISLKEPTLVERTWSERKSA